MKNILPGVTAYLQLRNRNSDLVPLALWRSGPRTIELANNRNKQSGYSAYLLKG